MFTAVEYCGGVEGAEYAVVIGVAGNVAEFANHNNVLASRVSAGNHRSGVRAYLYAALEFQNAAVQLVYVRELTRESLAERELQLCRNLCAADLEVNSEHAAKSAGVSVARESRKLSRRNYADLVAAYYPALNAVVYELNSEPCSAAWKRR